jgi:hypothetical protein
MRQRKMRTAAMPVLATLMLATALSAHGRRHRVLRADHSWERLA